MRESKKEREAKAAKERLKKIAKKPPQNDFLAYAETVLKPDFGLRQGALSGDPFETNIPPVSDISKTDVNRTIKDFDISSSDTSEIDPSKMDASNSDASLLDIRSDLDHSMANESTLDASKSVSSETDTSESDLSEIDASKSALSESDLSEIDASKSALSESDLSEIDASKSESSEMDIHALTNAFICESLIKLANSKCGLREIRVAIYLIGKAKGARNIAIRYSNPELGVATNCHPSHISGVMSTLEDAGLITKKRGKGNEKSSFTLR